MSFHTGLDQTRCEYWIPLMTKTSSILWCKVVQGVSVSFFAVHPYSICRSPKYFCVNGWCSIRMQLRSLITIFEDSAEVPIYLIVMRTCTLYRWRCLCSFHQWFSSCIAAAAATGVLRLTVLSIIDSLPAYMWPFTACSHWLLCLHAPQTLWNCVQKGNLQIKHSSANGFNFCLVFS